jgi:hypothetical protein
VKRHIGEGNGEACKAPMKTKTASNDPIIFLKFIEEVLALSDKPHEERQRPAISRSR